MVGSAGTACFNKFAAGVDFVEPGQQLRRWLRKNFEGKRLLVMSLFKQQYTSTVLRCSMFETRHSFRSIKVLVPSAAQISMLTCGK